MVLIRFICPPHPNPLISTQGSAQRGRGDFKMIDEADENPEVDPAENGVDKVHMPPLTLTLSFLRRALPSGGEGILK
jgi:hypothetical protein